MSDTPRTDAAGRLCDSLFLIDAYAYALWHGKNLELELNEANERISQLKARIKMLEEANI